MTIERLTLNDPEAQSADPVAANIAALKALFPAAVADGRIDFDTLRQLLGDEVDDGDERYGLNWPGKRRARRLALTPSTGTLRPAREDSVDWDTTRNLMIEGDNLEVLKLLQKSYAGQIKLIYIDPPYNTGNDFVYADDFSDTINSYLKRTGQTEDGGIRATTNPDSSGRYHSDWLDMITPRLMLAKSLMHKEGAIFISIDDNEVARLRSVCDEVFGEENFIAQVIWEKVHTRKNSARYFSTSHDYIVAYARSKPDWPRPLLPREDNSAYSNPDNHPKGPWKLDPITAHNPYSADYTITKPNGVVLSRPEGGFWRFSEETIKNKIADNALVWGSGNSYPMMKRFLSEVQDGLVPVTLFTRTFAGDSSLAKGETDDLFGRDGVFEYPKPTLLIRRLLQLGTKDGDTVLDFFAGSGTTGHAVMAQNGADGGQRRFIAVQLPEALDPADARQAPAVAFLDQQHRPRHIAEITKERLRRAAAKVRADHANTQADLGFRVYKLATSNLRAWAPGDNLAADLLAAADNIVQGRTEEDLLTELLLKQGIDLTEPMLTETIAGAPVHAMGGGVLVVCLAPVTAANAEALADGVADWIERLDPVAASTVFFKDAGFENDVAKANVAAILEQRLENKLLKVRSL